MELPPPYFIWGLSLAQTGSLLDPTNNGAETTKGKVKRQKLPKAVLRQEKKKKKMKPLNKETRDVTSKSSLRQAHCQSIQLKLQLRDRKQSKKVPFCKAAPGRGSKKLNGSITVAWRKYFNTFLIVLLWKNRRWGEPCPITDHWSPLGWQLGLVLLILMLLLNVFFLFSHNNLTL